jgi:hypothetical protein
LVRSTLLGVACALFAQAAPALNLTLSGPGIGPLTGGTGSLGATPGSSITFTIGLDSAPSLNGYDLTIAYDPLELSFLGASELSGLGFDAPPSGGSPGGERVAAIALQAVSSAALFSVSFQVTDVASDGLRDFQVYVDSVANGSGIAPGTLSLDNGSSGVGIDVVPEPASGALLVGALAGFASWRASARRRRS